MEKKESSFQLWSPPTLDLSLDSFSTDILSQFGKQEKATAAEINHSQVTDSSESLDLSPIEPSRSSVLFDSRLSSNLDRGATPSLIEEESNVNVFRKSSTFLKSRMSGSKRESAEITTESLVSIASLDKSYPPKPLEYAPVMEEEASVESIDHVSMESDGESETKQYQTVEIDTESLAVTEISTEKENEVTEKKVPESPPERIVCSQPKRRSIFFFRFC